jgi:death-on-curing protein
MNPPRWLSEMMIFAIHKAIATELGEYCFKTQNAAALNTILLKPQQRWRQSGADFAILAASYGFHLAHHAVFVTYNLQTAWLAMYTFLGLNGYFLETTEAEAFELLQRLKNQQLSETELAEWVRAHSCKISE